MDHVPAACERVSACGDDCGPIRGTDCFERGSVPFADFLYHENRRLELENPRTLAPHVAGFDADGGVSEGTPIELATISGAKSIDRTDVATEPGDRKTARQGAIVMNFSRPTLVAKFIDLYA